MKDFDAQKQREGTFKIAGEEFRYSLGASPQAIARLVKESNDRAKASTPTNGDAEQPEVDHGERILHQATDVDAEILFFLADDEERKRWKRMRRSEKGISLSDMGDVLTWLWEQETGRPPTQPGSSSASPPSSGTTSTEASSPEPVEASTT